MGIKINIKEFSFNLVNPIQTSQGTLKKKNGWLLNLIDSSGRKGWGEVSPLKRDELKKCSEIISNFGHKFSREELDARMSYWPGPLSFGIGSALADIDNFIGSNNNYI